MITNTTDAGLIWRRLQGKYRRVLSTRVARRRFKMQNTVPVISFTFDDFPDSALVVGGAILRKYGAVGTYYVSLGLLERDEPTGHICSAEDVKHVTEQGHELGCHTFAHCDAWETDPGAFEKSIVSNRAALKNILPEVGFETISYPISCPRPDTKRRAGRYFAGCRGGGQTFNAKVIDFNYMKAFFIEQSRACPDAIWELIDHNQESNGWLIFATHDISPRPTRFGCTDVLFEEIVSRSVASGARILPVGQALSLIRGESPALASVTSYRL